MDILNPKYIEINKPLIGQLFATGLYCYEDKFILEIIAPRDIIGKHHDDEDSDMTIGERWEMNLKELAESQWPLENSNYHLEVNGITVGEDAGTSTRFRYEPEDEQKEVNHNAVPESKPDTGFHELETLKPTEKGLMIPDGSEQKESIMNLFEDKEFQDTLISLLESIPAVDNPEDIKNYFEKKEKEEKLFFREYRSRTYIPDYLQDKSIVLAKCIFRGKNLLPLLSKIESLKFIMKRTTKYLLIRSRFVLLFGECHIQAKSDEWGVYTEKIWLEGIVESTREEGKVKNMPAGKKAVFIRYETVDNVLIQPLFNTTETLMSKTLDDAMALNETKKLEEKGKKGFNQYITFAGFVDEQADKADFELFQLIVHFELNKEIDLV